MTLAGPMAGADPAAGQATTPWSELDEQGQGLSVDVFMTTLMSQVGSALRRTVTVPCVQPFGLTLSQWRLLAVIAHAGRLSFAELVERSESDKALVSRTLRLLVARGLVSLVSEGSTPQKKSWCRITAEGAALHDEVLPVAQARQAQALRVLMPQERDALYSALQRLRAFCREAPADDASSAVPSS